MGDAFIFIELRASGSLLTKWQIFGHQKRHPAVRTMSIMLGLISTSGVRTLQSMYLLVKLVSYP